MSVAKELPQEIETDILSRADVKTLMRSRCVCKRWLVLISEHKFVKLHLQRSVSAKRKNILVTTNTPNFQSLDFADGSLVRDVKFPLLDKTTRSYDDIEIVGTCNGLFCLLLKDNSIAKAIPGIVIYNPSTGIYKELPAPLHQMEESMRLYWGFGYDSSNDAYKVVVGVNISKLTKKVMVINLNDNHWRTICQETSTKDIFCVSKSRFAEFLDGALHWVNFPEGVEVSACQKRIEATTCFDLAAETFKELPSLNLPLLDEVHWIDSIGVLGGCIWVSYCVMLHEINLELWIEHGDDGSWVKLFDVPMDTYDSVKPICFLGNGELLLEVHADDEYKLVTYSLLTGEIRSVVKCGGSRLYVESLVSPCVDQ